MNYYDIAFTPDVRDVQAREGAEAINTGYEARKQGVTGLGENERAFIAARDSFYMATVGSNGWPYMQHRGGPVGFLRVVDYETLAMADFRGNRQFISAGHLKASNRTALFLMDYANRARLKLYAETSVVNLEDDTALAEAVAVPGYRGKVERVFKFDVKGFDWNCPQHITERYTLAEVERVTEKYRARIQQLEADLAAATETSPT